MNETDKELLAEMANTIRGLAMDAIQRANSGHPGLPMGCAEIAACLYGKELIHNPANPGWLGRDRFVLSAGHGSMLLYAALHLAGYDLSLDDIRNFRRLGSRTPGHPEYGKTPGVETTTGPLGQGLAMAAGMALANKMTAARLGVEGEGLLDGKVFVLAGDGCMMEGVAHEAASLAGHLALDNLVAIYDSNDVCLDGPTDECFTEDTRARFKAYGWRVAVIDGHDFNQIERAVRAARRRKGCPSLIVAKTIIGRGSPNLQGTSKTHGAPLGEEEVRLAKESLGIPPEEFHVPEALREAMRRRLGSLKRKESAWRRRFAAWAAANPEKAALWDAYVEKRLPEGIDARIRAVTIPPNSPGRTASSAVLQKLHDLAPFLVGGSADLSCSDNTMMKASGIVAPGAYDERNVKYGVREFAMAAMTSGMALQGMTLPFCGTFLVFSDYMRNAIRLAALMQLRVVYQLTHDSILLGEDGPTHQPVEQLASLRAVPGLTVIRPADSTEVKAAWSCILTKAKGPVALVLSRQGLRDLHETDVPTSEGVGRGGYVVRRESDPDSIDRCLLASGSEVALALDVAGRLEARGESVRVVSMPSFEVFDAQDEAYRQSIIPPGAGECWSIEAGVSLGWHKYIGREGRSVSVESFGASAPGKVMAERFGFTTEKVLARMEAGR